MSGPVRFAGYAAIFRKRDSGGDTILPGAFKGSLERRLAEGLKLPLLWQHRPDQRIGWRAEEADVPNSGWVSFADAGPSRGTVVTAMIAYSPPAGIVGKLVAKVTQQEPAIQARRDLRRFKQLMETGEIATTTPPNREPKS